MINNMKMKKKLLTIILLAAPFISVCAQGYQNPILPGFHPDPSVCRAGDDYYVVNSSFQYYPGVPIHHSKDLVNWEPIGYCLDRPSQLKLDGAGFWGGIYAPSLRYHDGTFYMVVTNTSDKGNFYVYTDDPAGEWSEPVWVDRPGIDPDLFFDDDGKCYFISAAGNLQACEIDIKTGKVLSEARTLWNGTGGRCAEAPHVFKKDGYYYMLIAEGGTEYGHKATIARSTSFYGPYEANPANPILTHINANGVNSPIQGTGHADMVQAHDGSWWVVFLGFRPQSYTHHVLGRETFLAPVTWTEDGWPVVNGDGTVSLAMDCATLPQVTWPAQPTRNDFNDKKLGYEWNTLCRPHDEQITLTERKGYLRLHATTTKLEAPDSPIFVGRRQEHINFRATTALDFSALHDGAEAGLTVYMATDYHYDLSVVNRSGQAYLRLRYHLSMLQHVEKEIPLTGSMVYLRVEGNNDAYTFLYSTDGADYQTLAGMNTRFLSSETAGGFTGVYIGLFAQTDKADSSVADFDWFEYEGK